LDDNSELALEKMPLRIPAECSVKKKSIPQDSWKQAIRGKEHWIFLA
jgi:hypothetical protein